MGFKLFASFEVNYSTKQIKIIPILNLVAYIWILFDSEKQGLHDKIANTFVVRE
ncbi:MAG: RDD family protein [Candidatus Methanofastidiosum sp.]|nr:RDD family protein [Methanofastidiosum sp.]